VSLPTEVTDIDAVDDTGPSRKQRVKKKWSQIKKVNFLFCVGTFFLIFFFVFFNFNSSKGEQL
jgi:hypothetical protein